MHPLLHHLTEIANGVRGRIAVCFTAIDFGALAAAVARFAGHSAVRAGQFGIVVLAALWAGKKERLRAFGAVAPAMLRLFVGEVHAVLLRVFAYGCALAAMGLMVSEFVALPRSAVVAQAMPETEWVEVGRPFPAFALAMPEFDDAARYAIWRHANGGGRKDILTFGDLGSKGATAVVELYRPGAEPGHAPEELTASVPELRLSGAPKMPRTMETKFGTMQVEPFVDHAPGGERRCLRFARAFADPRFEIAGWYCNAGLDIVDRGMIACALDRLTLVAAGSDQRVGALFAQAEQKRTFCGANSVFIAATHKRNDWIEATRDPRLRGRQ